MMTPRRAKPEPQDPLLAMLAEGIRQGHVDAVPRARAILLRLDNEISALAIRRELVAQRIAAGQEQDRRPSESAALGFVTIDLAGMEARLAAEIAAKAAVVEGLAELLQHAARSARRVQDGGEGPTLESYARPARQDPVAMLHGKGLLTTEQVEAAREIAWVFEEVTKAGMAKIGRMDAAGRAPAGGWLEPEPGARVWEVYERKFVPWSARVRGRTFRVTIAVAVDGWSIKRVARWTRMRWSGCVAVLADGLDEYLGRR